MQLIDDAGKVLRKAWSVRLMLLAAVLSAAEIGLPFLYPGWPPHIAAIASFCVTLAAFVARFVAQPKMGGASGDAAK